jgi:hypothetical protein
MLTSRFQKVVRLYLLWRWTRSSRFDTVYFVLTNLQLAISCSSLFSSMVPTTIHWWISCTIYLSHATFSISFATNQLN